MISTSTFAFVLVLVAFAFVALASIIWWMIVRRVDSALDTMRHSLNQRAVLVSKQSETVHAKLRELADSSPTKLAAEVAALSDAVSGLAETHRRFAGKVWQRIGERERERADDEAMSRVGNGLANDDELAAVLALQTATPPQPRG